MVRLTETNGKVARLFGLLGIFLEKSNGIKLLYTYRLNCDCQSIFLCLKNEWCGRNCFAFPINCRMSETDWCLMGYAWFDQNKAQFLNLRQSLTSSIIFLLFPISKVFCCVTSYF